MDMPACPPAEDEIILPAPPPPSDDPFEGRDPRGRHLIGVPGPGRIKGGPNAKTQVTHAALIDYLLANPRATLVQMAAAFGWKSTQSVSIIINSDSFQAALAKRQEQICDPILTQSIEDRIKGLASKSAEILREKLDQNPSEKLVLEVFKESTRAGSYGVKAPVAIQQQFVVALPGPASNSQEWLERFRPNTAGVVAPRLDDAPVEVDVKEVK